MVEQARLGRNSSLDSWEDAEGGVEVGVGVWAGVGVEGAADFSLLASFFRTASFVLWSVGDEVMLKRPSREEVKRANFFLKESLCFLVTVVLMRAL